MNSGIWNSQTALVSTVRLEIRAWRIPSQPHNRIGAFVRYDVLMAVNDHFMGFDAMWARKYVRAFRSNIL